MPGAAPAEAAARQLRGRAPATGVTPKDLILYLIGRIGAAGGTGYAVEYAGDAIRALDVEGRLTLCNLSIELGAKMGMVAPDDTTFAYLADRPFAPKGALWEAALAALAPPAVAMRTPLSTARSASTSPPSRRRSPGAPARSR